MVLLIWTGMLLWIEVTTWTLTGRGMGLIVSNTTTTTMALSGPREQRYNSDALLVAESIGSLVMTALAGTCYVILLAEEVPAFGWISSMLLVISVLAIAVSLRIGSVRGIAG